MNKKQWVGLSPQESWIAYRELQDNYQYVMRCVTKAERKWKIDIFD